MIDLKSNLLKIGNIVGTWYTHPLFADSVVVYAQGAPVLPDGGSLPDALSIVSHGVDLFVPDYLGYGRSGGKFTPLNCVKTLLSLYDGLSQGCVGTNDYEELKLKLKYKRVIFIGKSFGGNYVALLPKFNKKITEIGLIYPAVENKSQGEIEGEETNKQFFSSMEKDGYCHLYRGILTQEWKNHFEGLDKLSAIDNVEYLGDVRLFIGHGKQDKCIHYSKSIKYYKKVLATFPKNKAQFKLKLYAVGDHGPSTSNRAVGDFLTWLGVGRKI